MHCMGSLGGNASSCGTQEFSGTLAKEVSLEATEPLNEGELPQKIRGGDVKCSQCLQEAQTLKL